jgi:hypothetical protein
MEDFVETVPLESEIFLDFAGSSIVISERREITREEDFRGTGFLLGGFRRIFPGQEASVAFTRVDDLETFDKFC